MLSSKLHESVMHRSLQVSLGIDYGHMGRKDFAVPHQFDLEFRFLSIDHSRSATPATIAGAENYYPARATSTARGTAAKRQKPNWRLFGAFGILINRFQPQEQETPEPSNRNALRSSYN
jgi:hypothetical protein